ncbi:hypothetical protein [Pectobacterium parmentieri]|uniref:hypothetical protein n=1 Tax=Pectobacterium parmentieri TaxID=1905730 RepID=UPI0018DF4CBA|nr:hypothetical protein [Pectobacterium parmentieri]MBI0575340.1 hypothetical protein [Pectobacterium parmentieri]
MSDNIDQFSIYAAKVFETLYDSFPVPIAIKQREVIADYLNFDNYEELKQLRIRRDIADIVDCVEDEDLKATVKEKRPAIEARLAELERDQRNGVDRQERIFNGTLDFLCWEGLIRHCDNGYQLTAKGFSHLNKSFKGGEIAGENDKNISVLKAVFEKSSETSLQVAVGTIVNVLTKVLGYS